MVHNILLILFSWIVTYMIMTMSNKDSLIKWNNSKSLSTTISFPMNGTILMVGHTDVYLTSLL